MIKDVHYDLPPDFNKRGFFDKLRKDLRTRKDADATGSRVYLDTFDWRLYKESLRLYSTGDRLVLDSMEGEIAISAIDTATIPVFAGDVPESNLRDRLVLLIEMRALIPLVEAATTTTSVRILNRDEKTVARVELEDVRLVEGKSTTPVCRHVRLKPVRGYDRQAEDLETWLRRKGFAPARADSFSSLLEAGGKRPRDYSAKLNFKLDPGMGSYDALVRIYRFLSGVMRQNIDGVKQDIDTEFLHDFRVASRRTRAGLVQLKKVLPGGVAGSFRKRFSVFGKATNRLRDLDVYLLNADSYRDSVPDHVREHIEALFEHLKFQRTAELDRVRAWLDSEECLGTLNDWERALGEAVSEDDANQKSILPVIDLANSSIRSRRTIVVELGTKVAAEPEDSALHTLRIECKKLRYLLEFFSSLYDRKKIAALIKQLKLLQDNLGRHQDICFQQEGLKIFAEEMSGAGDKTKMTHVAVGALIGSLETDKQNLRDSFTGVWRNFASPANTRLFEELFARHK